jgi:hypothetical protein
MHGYKPPYKYVEMIWDDAASNSDAWVHKDDIQEPEQVITRGWMIKEDDRAVYLASSVSNIKDFEDTVGNTMTIPKGMIVTRRDIRVSNASSKSRNNLRTKPGTEELHREQSKG